MTRRPGFLGTGCALFSLLGLALAGWLLWKSSFWLVDRVADMVPTSWEEKFGRGEVMRESARFVQDPVIVKGVDRIFNRLVKALPPGQPYHFAIHPVWDPQENAFAAPGGEVLITTGLLAAAKTPDEVAGVLGHECQHVLGRHALHGMARKVGLSLVLMYFVGDQGIAGAIAQSGSSLLGLSFDRGQEWEADQAGVRFSYDAGYRPQAMADFFRRQKEAADLDPSAEKLLTLLSDHPADTDRLNQIDKLAGALPERAQHKDDSWELVRKHAHDIPAKFAHPEEEK